jgi:hypothetical protein
VLVGCVDWVCVEGVCCLTTVQAVDQTLLYLSISSHLFLSFFAVCVYACVRICAYVRICSPPPSHPPSHPPSPPPSPPPSSLLPVCRAWDDYLDYATYLTGERNISTTTGATTGTGALSVSGTVSLTGTMGDRTATGPPPEATSDDLKVSMSDAVVVAAKPRSGMVRSLMDRKAEAMASTLAKRRAGEREEEERRAAGGSGGVGRTSFTVDDSDALDTPWGVDEGTEGEEERELPDAAAVGMLGDIDEDSDGDRSDGSDDSDDSGSGSGSRGSGRGRTGSAASDDDDDFRFLDRFLRSRSGSDGSNSDSTSGSSGSSNSGNGSGSGTGSGSGSGIPADRVSVRVVAATPSTTTPTPTALAPAAPTTADTSTDRASRARAVDEALQLLGLAGSDAALKDLTIDIDLDFAKSNRDSKKQPETKAR